MTRTDLAFTGTIRHRFYDSDKQLITLQFREDNLVKTQVDTSCTVSSLAIDSALSVVKATPLIAIATSDSIISGISLIEAKIFTAKYLFSRERNWLQIVFTSVRDVAEKLKPGTAVQIFQVDPNGECQVRPPSGGSSGGAAG